ncbi:MAG: CorA family divalent cation transporter [Clostridia bacterium]
MQKILFPGEMTQYAEFIDPEVVRYISQGQTQAFESFEKFTLLAFDWYNIGNPESTTAKILIYFDKENLFFLCENEKAVGAITEFFTAGLSNEKALYSFFVGLLKNDMNYLDNFESEITNAENDALKNFGKSYLEKIVQYRKESLRLKHYYEQLDAIFDNLVCNENGLLSKDSERHLFVLHNRVERFYHSALNIRDYITQMREAYQAQIDIEQNNIMKIFTLITAVFLPLTLLVGWYGMNFINMPELTWQFGYPAVTVFSILLCVGLVVYFKRKKWF